MIAIGMTTQYSRASGQRPCSRGKEMIRSSLRQVTTRSTGGRVKTSWTTTFPPSRSSWQAATWYPSRPSRTWLRHLRCSLKFAGLVALTIAAACVPELVGAAGLQHHPSQTSRAPPVRYLPLSQVEPPRTVRASAWRSPYCTKWLDGCEACARASARDRPKCTSIETSDQSAECRPHGVMCTDVDRRLLDRICAVWTSYSLGIDVQRRLLAGETIQSNGRFGGGQHNDWGRTKRGYRIVSNDYLGPLTITLQSVQRALPGVEIGRADIRTIYCRSSYVDLPPQPAN